MKWKCLLLGHFIYLVLFAFLLKAPVHAKSRFQYNLYKNPDNFGIVVFPPPNKNSELEIFIQSQGFVLVDSGGAFFRYGSKHENATYMMPENIQNKHLIKKFITIQILSRTDFMIGVFDPEWGLTLPRDIYILRDLKKNIPKTLKIFKGQAANGRET